MTYTVFGGTLNTTQLVISVMLMLDISLTFQTETYSVLEVCAVMSADLVFCCGCWVLDYGDCLLAVRVQTKKTCGHLLVLVWQRGSSGVDPAGSRRRGELEPRRSQARGLRKAEDSRPSLHRRRTPTWMVCTAWTSLDFPVLWFMISVYFSSFTKLVMLPVCSAEKGVAQPVFPTKNGCLHTTPKYVCQSF